MATISEMPWKVDRRLPAAPTVSKEKKKPNISFNVNEHSTNILI